VDSLGVVIPGASRRNVSSGRRGQLGSRRGRRLAGSRRRLVEAELAREAEQQLLSSTPILPSEKRPTFAGPLAIATSAKLCECFGRPQPLAPVASSSRGSESATATADVAILNADVLTVLDTRNCNAAFLDRAWPARTRPFIMIHDVGCRAVKAISLSCC